MASFHDIDQKQAQARYALNLKNDRVRAAALGVEALELLATVDLPGSKLGTLHHNLAALFRDLDDLERCEPLARRAVELELADEASPYPLGDYYMFLAVLLHDRGKSREALGFAREGERVFLRVRKLDDPEMNFVRADVARIAAAAGE
jgi:hypothetical protein